MLSAKLKSLLSIVAAVSILSLFPTLSFGGELYGEVRSSGKVSRVEINCGGKPFRSSVDRYGFYSVQVRSQGRCQIRFQLMQGWTNPYSIRSYREPFQYDFYIDSERNLHRR